jgi:hypothetical protein
LLFPGSAHDLLPYLPYGYFTVHGIVATGIFIRAFLVSFNRDGTWLPWICLLSAVIFNPVMKLPLPHEIRIMAYIAAGDAAPVYTEQDKTAAGHENSLKVCRFRDAYISHCVIPGRQHNPGTRTPISSGKPVPEWSKVNHLEDMWYGKSQK